MNSSVLSASARPAGAAELRSFCAVVAEVDPAALDAVVRERRDALRRDPNGVFERAAAVAGHYDRWFAANGVRCPLPGQIAATARNGLPVINPAVDTLLYAEMTTGVLMGVQDGEAVNGPLRFDWAEEAETFPGIRSTVTCAAKEPVVRDGTGIVASVLQGPDKRTSVTKGSRHLVFTVYDAPGLPASAFDGAVRLLCELLESAQAAPRIHEVAL